MACVLSCEAMRTRFEIVLDDDRDEGALRAAGEEAIEEIKRTERMLSVFRRDADLFDLNAHAAQGPVRVDGALFAFLKRAGDLCTRLQGAVDPTVGALVAHFRAGAPGGDDEWQRLRACVGFADQVRLDAEKGAVTFARAGVRLDAGALGKGYALGRAADVLRECGIERALLHGGTSSALAMGAPRGQQGWVVALQHPTVDAEFLGRVILRDSALSVSSILGRTFEVAGRQVGHVIDPRRGLPVSDTWLAAAVGPDALDVEAISTALLVLGTPGMEIVSAAFVGTSCLIAAPDAQGGLVKTVAGLAFG